MSEHTALRLAAIQRDIKLQSGVVRGDEFNSIMEQSPRLSQAMADGLGVTKGELRAMAMEGQLTSEVVIKAVQSQAATITEEFATLPTTVGDSLQVLKNKMFDFVGTMDKSVNQSSKLADAVNMVSEALDDMDPGTVEAVNEIFNQLINTLGTVGGIIAGLYENLNGWIAALTGSVESTGEKVGFLTRTIQGVSIALGVVNDALSAVGIAFNLVYGVSTKWLSAIANGLAALSFGDLSDSLSALSKRLETESVRAFGAAEEAAMNFKSAAVTALDEAAKTNQQRLSEMAETATAKFKEMSQSGEASAEALEGAFVRMAQAQVKAHGQNALAALQAIGAEQGLKVAIDDTGKAIVDKMTDDELAASSITANAKKIDAAYNKLAETVGVGLTAGYREAKAAVMELSGNFEVLTESGYDAGEVMVGALQSMIKNAKNTTELQDLIVMWNDLGEQGQLTGEDLAAGLDLANERLDALTEGVNSVNEAYKLLGLTTRQEAAKQAAAYSEAYGMIVKDGEATSGQLTEAFKKTARAQIAANGDIIDANTKAQAAQRGLTVTIDETGRVSFQAMDKAARATDAVKPPIDRATASFGGLGNSANDAGNSMKSSADKAYKAYDKLQDKLEKLKEAQNALAEKRQKELAPPQGNQFGTRLGVENFFKSAGLDEKQAAEQARKLYAKAGKQDGALNFAELQGFKEGQLMTTQDLQNFKSASVFLSEIAQKAKNQSRDSSRTEKEDDYDKPESKSSSNSQSNSPSAEEKRQAQLLYNDRLEKLLAAQDSGASAQALSDLTKMVEVAADQYKSYGVITQNLEKSSLDWAAQSMGANLPKAPDQAPAKTVKIEIKQGSKTITADVPAGQENDWTEFARQLGESRSVAGY